MAAEEETIQPYMLRELSDNPATHSRLEKWAAIASFTVGAFFVGEAVHIAESPVASGFAVLPGAAAIGAFAFGRWYMNRAVESSNLAQQQAIGPEPHGLALPADMLSPASTD